MSNTHIYIVVEGLTELTFIRDVLAPEIAHKRIYLYPTQIGKPGHKGGDVRFDRAKDDIGRLLKQYQQHKNVYISTMLDYFRIDKDWPGRTTIRQKIKNGTTLTAVQKAEILEAATLKEILSVFQGCNADNRFIPFITMHEFEALLFSDADILAKKTGIEISQINKIIKECGCPEEINDDPINAPCKRLEALKNGYRKVAMGKSISETIGIQTIRQKCSHFDDWITKLENLIGKTV